MENRKNTWPGWETVRRIGSGGFGTVYEIQRDVYGDLEKAALKVITIPHSEDEVDYLRCTGLTDDNITQTLHKQVADIAREYKLMAQMRDNPNVVRCDDFRDIQHEDGLGWDIYIKMELLTPLMKCLDKVQTEEQILKLGMDICNALIACQEKNIIHRDIKPQNIFISDKGQFKLGDFGIARTAERTTRATAGIGTYSYMAPEVEKNEAYGKTADIYSLGLVLYWLLNERRSPFMPLPPAVPGYGDEENARNRRFRGEQIPAPINGSDELKAIILKACAYDPKERYQTATEMLQALEEIHTGKTAAGESMAEEEPTVGHSGGNNTEEPVAEDLTVGPTWGDAPVTEETEVTVGPVFYEKEMKQPQTDSSDKSKETQLKPKKKKWWVVAATIVICAGIGISFFKKPADRTSNTEQMQSSESVSVGSKEKTFVESSDGWVQIDGNMYYYKDGIAVTGVQSIDGDTFCFDDDGTMQTGWQRIDGNTYYFAPTGVMQTGQQQIDGITCYFNFDGTAITGLQEIGGDRYYFRDGKAQNGWIYEKERAWYFDKDDGKLIVWSKFLNEKHCYFDSDDIPLTGWHEIDGRRYYFETDGAALMGLQEIGGETYYFGYEGKMSTGWQLINEQYYFFDEDGKLVE